MMITYIIFFSIGDPRTICLGFLLKLLFAYYELA